MSLHCSLSKKEQWQRHFTAYDLRALLFGPFLYKKQISKELLTRDIL